MRGVAVDANGNIYIANPNAGKIVKETLANGAYSQSVVVSSLSDPESVAVDASGNVYYATGSQTLSDSGVFKETLTGGTYTRSTVIDQLGTLTGIALDSSGNLYIADEGDREILKETLSGGSYTNSVIMSANPSTDTNSQGTVNPLAHVAIAADAAGDIYFIDKTGEFEEVALSNGVYSSTVLTSIGTRQTQAPKPTARLWPSP